MTLFAFCQSLRFKKLTWNAIANHMAEMAAQVPKMSKAANFHLLVGMYTGYDRLLTIKHVSIFKESEIYLNIYSMLLRKNSLFLLISRMTSHPGEQCMT